MIPNCNNMPDFCVFPNIQALPCTQEGPTGCSSNCVGLYSEACSCSGAVEGYDLFLVPSSWDAI